MAINSRKWWGLYFKEKTIIMENIISNFSQVLQNSVPFSFVNFHLSNLSSLSSNTKNVFRLRFTCVNRCSLLLLLPLLPLLPSFLPGAGIILNCCPC